MKHLKLSVVLLMALTSVACAKVDFGTQWSLEPGLTPENASFNEFQRRESERRHEVAALKAERLEIGQKLDQLYNVYVLRDSVWTDGNLDLTVAGWYMEQKLDTIAALERITVLSERLALLTNRPVPKDKIAVRARSILGYVKAWKPTAIPHYR